MYSLNRDSLTFIISNVDIGGLGRVRTDDFLLAKQALSQLSYKPTVNFFTKETFERESFRSFQIWHARLDSNQHSKVLETRRLALSYAHVCCRSAGKVGLEPTTGIAPS